MKNKLIAILIALVIILASCGSSSGKKEVKAIQSKEFEVLSEDYISNSRNLTIVRHIETGKRFIIYMGYRSGGITPLD